METINSMSSNLNLNSNMNMNLLISNSSIPNNLDSKINTRIEISNKKIENSQENIYDERISHKLQLRKNKLKNVMNLKRNKLKSQEDEDESEEVHINMEAKIKQSISSANIIQNIFESFKLQKLYINLSESFGNIRNSSDPQLLNLLLLDFTKGKNCTEPFNTKIFYEISDFDFFLFNHFQEIDENSFSQGIFSLNDLSKNKFFNSEQILLIRDTILPLILSFSILLYKLFIRKSKERNQKELINIFAKDTEVVDKLEKENLHKTLKIANLKAAIGSLIEAFINLIAIDMEHIVDNNNTYINLNINENTNVNFNKIDPIKRICGFFYEKDNLFLLFSFILDNITQYNLCNPYDSFLICSHLDFISDSLYILGNIISDTKELSDFIILNYNANFIIETLTAIINILPDPCYSYLEDICYVMSSIILYSPLNMNCSDIFIYHSGFFKELFKRMTIIDNQTGKSLSSFFKLITGFVEKHNKDSIFIINLLDWKLMECLISICYNNSNKVMYCFDVLLNLIETFLTSCKDTKVHERILFYLGNDESKEELDKNKMQVEETDLMPKLLSNACLTYQMLMENKEREQSLRQNRHVQEVMQNKNEVDKINKTINAISAADKINLTNLVAFCKLIFTLSKLNSNKQSVFFIIRKNDIPKVLSTWANSVAQLDKAVVKAFCGMLENESLEIKKYVFNGGEYSFMLYEDMKVYLSKESKYRSIEFSFFWLRCMNVLLRLSREILLHTNIVKITLSEKGFVEIICDLQLDTNKIVYDEAIKIMNEFFPDYQEENYDGYI